MSSVDYSKGLALIDTNLVLSDTSIAEITITNDKIFVPGDFNTTLATLDPQQSKQCMEMSNCWINDVCAPYVKKVKRPKKELAEANKQLFKDATEKDLMQFLDNSNTPCIQDTVSEILHKRLMSVHFKLAFFIRVGKLLKTSDLLTKYFSENTAR